MTPDEFKQKTWRKVVANELFADTHKASTILLSLMYTGSMRHYQSSNVKKLSTKLFGFDRGNDEIKDITLTEIMDPQAPRYKEAADFRSVNAEVEVLLRERTEMLYVLAHEVRQPLNNASAAMQSAQAEMRGAGMGVAGSITTSSVLATPAKEAPIAMIAGAFDFSSRITRCASFGPTPGAGQ